MASGVGAADHPVPVIDVHAHLAPAGRLDELRALSPTTTPSLRFEGAPPGAGEGGADPTGHDAASDAEHVYFDYPDGTVNGPVPRAIVDVDRRLGDMARTGVDHQVLSTRPQMFSYDSPGPLAAKLARLSNENLVEVSRRHPQRFSALLALPMQDTELSLAEIEHWAPHREVRGVMIDSNLVGRDFADPAFAPIWSALEEADLSVLVHPYQGDVVGMDRLRKHYLFNLIGNPIDTTIAMANVVFGGLVDRYPALRWGFVHGGGVAPYLVGRWDHGWHQREVTRALIPGKLPSELLRTFWYDCIVHDPRTLAYLGEVVGWERLMIGSDCPFDMGYVDPVAFMDHAPAQASRRALLSDNATDFLRDR